MQVDLVITPAKRHLRTAADDQERRLLGIGAGDRVERVQRPWSVSHQRHAQAPQPRVGVRRKPHARLVAADHRRKPQRLLNRVDGKNEIARNAERVPDPQLTEAMKEILGQVHRLAFPSGPGVVGLAGFDANQNGHHIHPGTCGEPLQGPRPGWSLGC